MKKITTAIKKKIYKLTDEPTNLPSRILVFSVLISSLIIHAIYSACITSYITQLTADLPFNNFDDFIRSGSNYKMTVLKESRDEDQFVSLL